MIKVPKQVNIFEVGPRDGLQNEAVVPSTENKLKFIQGLARAGLKQIEVGAFVRPDKVAQMADTDALLQLLHQNSKQFSKQTFFSLVPNMKGLERAIAADVSHIAVFTAVSNTFNQKNIGMTVEESFAVIADVMKEAKRKKIHVRGYVSTVFGCPFEGKIKPKDALKVIYRLLRMGVDEVSIGDTIGVATPRGVDEVVKPALLKFGPKKVAVHFHDTRGTALANTLRSLEHGVRTVDSSAGGLGGCPYAPGATGNLATEDLVYMLDGMGVKTGVDLKWLCETSLELHKVMNRPIVSRYLKAYASQK